MFKPDPKHAVSVILGIHPHEDGPEEHESGGDVDPKLTAAEDVIKALHDDSPHALVTALQSFFELCDSEPHEEGPHEDDEEESEEK